MSNGTLDKQTLLKYGGALPKSLIKSLTKSSSAQQDYKTLEETGIPPITLANAKAGNMLGYKIYGNSEQGGLPNGYTLLQWIENTGTEYIDLNFIPNQDTRVVMDFQLTQTSETGFALFGSRVSTTSRGYTFQKISNGWWGGMYGNTLINSGTVQYDTNRHTLDKNKNIVYLDGNLLMSFDAATFTCPGNMVLFGMDNNGTPTVSAEAIKMYSLKVYDNGTLIRDLVPCKNTSGVVGMYDTVNDVFYGNDSGSGAFVAGATLPTPTNNVEVEGVGNYTGLPYGYTELDYIEADGTQYIDTGFSPDANTRVDFKVKFLQDALEASPLIGARVGSDGKSRFFPIGYFNPATDYRISYGNAAINNSIDFTIDYEGSFQPQNEVVVLNGVSYSLSGNSFTKTANNNLFLFATSGYGDNLYQSKGRIYYCKIWDNGTPVRDFVPCKNDSNVVGMYDLINKVFYAGTGVFVAGNEIGKGGYKIPVTVTDSNNVATTTNIYLSQPLRKIGVGTPVILPNGYTQLNYIESTETQYIDTGITATDKTGMKIKYSYTASGSAAISGIFKSAAPRQDVFFISTSNGQTSSNIFFAHRGATFTTSASIVIGDDYTCEMNYLNSGKIYFNDTLIGNVGSNNTYDATIPIFARYSVGSSSYSISNSRIYYAEFTEGNVVSHLFIPCIDPQGVVGMYDVITGTFHGNAGTGDFVAGSVVFADYIDFQNQKVIRNITELTVTGYEDNWEFITASRANIARFRISSERTIANYVSSTDELCNYFPCESISTVSTTKGASVYYSTSAAIQGTLFRARYDGLNDLATSVAFFKGLYDAGTPVKIYYPSSTPTEESVILPAILLNKGVNVISVGTTPQPSNMWIKYKGKEE